MFIELNGYGDFKVFLDVGKISMYGLDPGPKLFVRCDGQDISITENVMEQLSKVKAAMDEHYGQKVVAPIRYGEGRG